jgi:hypothetical protein
MSIKLKGSTDGSVTLQAPADTSPTGTDKTLILPTGVGSANQILRNGSTAGTLEFATIERVKRTYSTEVSIASGDTEVEFTGIPANFSRLRIIFNDISLSGTDHIHVQIGHAASGGTYFTTGYTSYGGTLGSSSNAGNGITTAFRIRLASASNHLDGYMELFPNKASSPSRLFEFNSAVRGDAAAQRIGAGYSPDISSVTIDRIKMITSGSNTFDDANGRINLITEVIE